MEAGTLRSEKTPHFNELRGNLADAGENLKQAAASALPAAQEELQRVTDYARETAQNMTSSMTDCIHERPMTWVVVAAGLGLCVGMIMARGR